MILVALQRLARNASLHFVRRSYCVRCCDFELIALLIGMNGFVLKRAEVVPE